MKKQAELILTIAFTLLLRHTQAQGALRVVAVLDMRLSDAAADLEYAVTRLNRAGGPLPMGTTITVDTIITEDHKPVQAMEHVCSSIASGASAIIDMSSGHVRTAIRDVAESNGIAHITALDPMYFANERGSYPLSLNFIPPTTMMTQVIYDLIAREGYNNAVIFYDHTFNLKDKPKNMFRDLHVSHMFMEMGMTDDIIWEQVARMKELRIFNIFLACSAGHASTVLEMATSMDMFEFNNLKYNWIIICLDGEVMCPGCIPWPSHTISFTTITGQPVSPMDQDYLNLMPDSKTKLVMSGAFAYDMMCLVGKSLASLSATGSWSQSSFSTCNLTPVEGGQAARSKAEELIESLKVQADLYMGVFGSFEMVGTSGQEMIRLEIKKHTYIGDPESMPAAIVSIGDWSQANGLDGTLTSENARPTVRIGVVIDAPWTFKSEGEHPPADVPKGSTAHWSEDHQCWYYGYTIDLAYALQEHMDFILDLEESPDGLYGMMQPDGSWNGVINELVDDHVDIAVGPLHVMAERELVVDFTTQFYEPVGSTILLKKPEATFDLFTFLRVFDRNLWICISAAFVVVSLLLAIFDRWSPFSFQNITIPDDAPDPRVFTFTESMWFCMCSLCPQGGGEAPNSFSGRLVAGTWWLFAYIVIACYMANLAAFLTVSRLGVSISSIDDLAAQFDIQYAPKEATSVATYFTRMSEIEARFYGLWKAISLDDKTPPFDRAQLAVWTYPLSDKFKTLIDSMRDTGFPKTFMEAVIKIKDENQSFAFIGDASQNTYAALTDCKLMQVGTEFSLKPYAIAVQKGQEGLRDQISETILNLAYSNYLEDIRIRWWAFRNVECPVDDGGGGIPMESLGGGFLLIILGIMCGTVALMWEAIYKASKGVYDDLQKKRLELEDKAREELMQNQLSFLHDTLGTG